MTTHSINNPLWHSNPLRHPFKDRCNAPRIQRPAHLVPTDQPTKYRSLADLRMLQPHFEPLHRLPREIRHPSVPFRIRLAPSNERLAGAVRVKIDIRNLKRDELAPPRER